MLPQDFLTRMEQMLGEEYPSFIDSYNLPKYQALRLNSMKVDANVFMGKNSFHLTPVSWSEYGYYYSPDDHPGKHAWHEAGIYYIQEPSAMAPATYLEAQPGERILDLCAAPGGKSTQIAASMKGQGLLICNEILPARAKILSENVERMGISNAIVTNETPASLSNQFPGYFDRIMVDAPCSGEGMFRKNNVACDEWSVENVDICANRQDEILDCAAHMLKAGGRMVYSTCTFAPKEDEESISRFLLRHPDFQILPVPKYEGMSDGIPSLGDGNPDLTHTIRLWPHHLKGEGHYLAVLQKAGNPSVLAVCDSANGKQKGLDSSKECKEYLDFCMETLVSNDTKVESAPKLLPAQGVLLRFGDQLYMLPPNAPSLNRLKVLRPGLHLGTLLKNRFEPSHALALSLNPSQVKHSVDLSSQEKTVYEYLNGQTFSQEGEKGWYLVTVDGYSLGWGKLAAGIMKNHYPKGLRKNIVRST